jgi:CheY-like chemotaxis protein
LALPGMNGFELIGAISRRPNRIKMIATTNVYKNQQLEVAGALGAHAVIRKPPVGSPLPEREWLATVRRLIGPVSEKRAGSGQGMSTESAPEPLHGNDANQ